MTNRLTGAYDFEGSLKFSRYLETGAALPVIDDGDATYSVTIPLDGRAYSVALDQNVDLFTTSAPTAPVIGSAVVYFVNAGGKAVAFPVTWYWPNGVISAIASGAGDVSRLVLVTDPAGNIHADVELRKVPA